MIINRQGRILQKTGLVWIMAIALSFACSADVQAAPANPVKQSPAEPAKSDPNEWKKVIEAAKKEGKIVISGAPGEGWRKSLVDMFQQEYPEITVEFSAASGPNFWPRVRQERALGKKLWDLLLGGANTAFDAKQEGGLAPVRPLLLPEIADDSKWIGGLDGTFNDREKNIYLATTYTSSHRHM